MRLPVQHLCFPAAVTHRRGAAAERVCIAHIGQGYLHAEASASIELS